MAAGNGNFPDEGDRRYIAAAMDAPMLERDYEVGLGRRWRGVNTTPMHYTN